MANIYHWTESQSELKHSVSVEDLIDGSRRLWFADTHIFFFTLVIKFRFNRIVSFFTIYFVVGFVYKNLKPQFITNFYYVLGLTFFSHETKLFARTPMGFVEQFEIEIEMDELDGAD